MIKGQITIKKLPKSEVEIIIVIPWEEIKITYEKLVERAASELQIKGFRKGKVPKKIVEENLDKSKIYSQVIQELIPNYYEEALRKNNLNPIVNPEITLVSSKENSDWEIKILICEKPQINLGNYKEELSKLNKTSDIWVPATQTGKEPQKDQQKKKDEKIQEIIKWLLENTKIELSDILIEQEVNRRLSELIDQTQKLGLTVEQYLISSGKTTEILKDEYRKQAYETWLIELALNQIADEENIVVDNKEIEETIQKIPSEEEKRKLEAQRYLLASIIRRQKTLDFLASL